MGNIFCQDSTDDGALISKRCVRPFTISPVTTVKISPDSRLLKDQTLTKTALQGLEINNKRISINNIAFYIQHDLSPDVVMRGIVDTGNTETNKVTQNFYITSFGGLKTKVVKANKINLMMNATIDLPIVEFPNKNLEKLRVPITDKEPQTLGLYIGDVADKIHENYLKNGNTLLYCHDGTLNSVVLAIGYLIKYTDLPLSEAMLHLQFTRKGFDSNLGNFQKQILKFASKFNKNDVCEDYGPDEEDVNQTATELVPRPVVAGSAVKPASASKSKRTSTTETKKKK